MPHYGKPSMPSKKSVVKRALPDKAPAPFPGLPGEKGAAKKVGKAVRRRRG